MLELKPCPFCGEKYVVRNHNSTFGWFIACTKCGARTDYRGSKGASTIAWNRRADVES